MSGPDDMAGPALARLLTPGNSQEVPPSALPEVLARLGDPSTPVTWIHTEPGPEIIQALDGLRLHEVAVKSLREGAERPRVEEFADHVYISLFSAEAPAGAGTPGGVEIPGGVETPGGAEIPGGAGPLVGGTPMLHELPALHDLRLFLGPRWVISVGLIREPDYEVLAGRVRRQVFSQGRGAGFIAYHICEWLVESLQPALDGLDERIDALEDQVVLTTEQASVQELFSLKRDIVDLRRRVAPLRDVMQRLGSHGVLYVEPEAEVYFRDVHDDVMRVIELLDTYRETLSSALDLYLSSVSNRLNRVMKQLAVVATVFLPLSFIVGFFGTNFVDMPFGSFAWFMVMFALLFVSVVIMLVYARWRT